jgi:hypothetical protein
MDDILQLIEMGDSLYIGFGRQEKGGIGMMDLHTRQFKSFVRPLNATDGPPIKPVVALGRGDDQTIWMAEKNKLTTFVMDKGIWTATALTEQFPDNMSISSVAANEQWEVRGKDGLLAEMTIVDAVQGATNRPRKWTAFLPAADQAGFLKRVTETYHAKQAVMHSIGTGKMHAGAVEFRSLKPGSQWIRISDPEAIPNPPTYVMLHDSEAWIAGVGYIAVIDLEKKTARKYCHIQANGVSFIRVAGGYVWARFDNHLHRASLRDWE